MSWKMLCLVPPPSDNLVQALFRNAINTRDACASFTCFVTGDNLGIPVSLVDMICVRNIGEWCFVQHCEDMKRRQLQVEASREFEAPVG
jgi:hypothetical protein